MSRNREKPEIVVTPATKGTVEVKGLPDLLSRLGLDISVAARLADMSSKTVESMACGSTVRMKSVENLLSNLSDRGFLFSATGINVQQGVSPDASSVVGMDGKPLPLSTEEKLSDIAVQIETAISQLRDLKRSVEVGKHEKIVKRIDQAKQDLALTCDHIWENLDSEPMNTRRPAG